MSPRFTHGRNLEGLEPFPGIPVEIIMHILEEAACLDRQTALTISLVSSWARKLALPYLFSTLVYRNTPSISGTQVSKSSAHSRQAHPGVPDHVRRFVRNLWSESVGIYTPSSEIDFFQSCPNVENLALPSPSLRALHMAIQAQAQKPEIQSGESHLIFPSRLRSITIITHTFRYDWHFLVGQRLPGPNGGSVLDQITHLRILDMQISTYSPHAHLPKLTHIALPFLDLGNAPNQMTLRLPEGLLQHPSLQMIVLTVDERKFVTNRWYHVSEYSATGTSGGGLGSPRDNFRKLVTWAQEKDARVHVVLSPRIGKDACTEWEEAARGGMDIWQAAARSRMDESYGMGLPAIYPEPTKW
ncbi:hypothetical protein CERSUDRAFT_71182 [Gelatoporia subvermispora B]|uniref:Uncharacterized protein n=1 Tax=Ceriporiopsis subvermispora (strain B) TaxID=914234 RepID=M2QV35_CERS8|nr:hypothetical protein CERSUDRAFT_71182 [Gelatoporia subvermispora B]